MEQRVTLITLGYRDYQRARDFYTAMGWTVAWTDDDVIFFQAGPMIFALWGRDKLAKDSEVQDSGGWGGVTLAYNVGSPEDVDAALDEARAAGATIGREGAATFWGGYSGCSSIRTAIRGRLRTIRSGPSAGMGASRSSVG